MVEVESSTDSSYSNEEDNTNFVGCLQDHVTKKSSSALISIEGIDLMMTLDSGSPYTIISNDNCHF